MASTSTMTSRTFQILATAMMNSTDQTSFGNCSLLVSRSDFATYVQELNQATAFNVTLLEACQSDICNAIWGDGNADISGIGVRTMELENANC